MTVYDLRHSVWFHYPNKYSRLCLRLQPITRTKMIANQMRFIRCLYLPPYLLSCAPIGCLLYVVNILIGIYSLWFAFARSRITQQTYLIATIVFKIDSDSILAIPRINSMQIVRSIEHTGSPFVIWPAGDENLRKPRFYFIVFSAFVLRILNKYFVFVCDMRHLQHYIPFCKPCI